jgi:general secretion pathway protein K
MVTGLLQDKRRGVALLATMLAVALMTILVVDFTTLTALGYRSAANQADELRAYYLAKSGIQVGLAVLAQSAIANAPPSNGSTANAQHDSLDQLWAQPSPPIPLDGGLVSTQIVDEERKINLNLLFDPRKRQPDPTWTPIIERVLANAGASPDLLPILIDWLDPDSIESQGGAEADYYLRLMPPYEPRNGPMPTIFDLRMIKGMDDATFINLSHFLTAGPFSQAQINVNTAPAEVLAALAPQLENDPSLVKSIIDARADGPFAMITDLNNRVSGLPQDQTLQRLLTVSSDDFSITGDGGFAGARKRIYSTFKRIRLQRSGASFILANWHED